MIVFPTMFHISKKNVFHISKKTHTNEGGRVQLLLVRENTARNTANSIRPRPRPYKQCPLVPASQEYTN